MCYGDVLLFKQKTAYELRISDWSSDVCSSDLYGVLRLDDLVVLLELQAVARAPLVDLRPPFVERLAVRLVATFFPGGDHLFQHAGGIADDGNVAMQDRKSTRLNSSH